MPLTILSDADVRAVLDSITREEVIGIHEVLAEALHQYSTVTSAEVSGCAAANQPSRIAVKSRDGGTTLFMPASSDGAFGVKIVTLAETCKTRSGAPALPDLSSLSLSEQSSDNISTVSSGSRSSSSATLVNQSSSFPVHSSSSSTLASKTTTNTSHSSASDRHNQDKAEPGLKPLSPDTVDDRAPLSATSPRGSLTLLTPEGEPRALINASTITAFRTALVSTMLLKLRASVHTLTVFGAGLQAFWHIFVSILLRGDEIHHINIINRDFTRAQRLFMALGQTDNEAVADVVLNPKLKTAVLTPEYSEYPRLLKEYVRAADVMYCTTPATAPLFPGHYLTSTEGRRKARYIAAIGSYKSHMQELHEDIFRQAVRRPSDERHHGLHLHHKHAVEGGAVVVDTIEGAMREAGDIIKAGISGNSVVELGELVMLKKSHQAELKERERLQHKSPVNEHAKEHHHGLGSIFHHQHHNDDEHKRRRKEVDGGLLEWLQRGNVIYKGVGIGLMDIVVGMEVVRLAELKGIGTFVDDF